MNVLENRVIAITKSKDAAGDAFDELLQNGAELVFIPSISIEPIKDNPNLDKAIAEISTYNYLIFASAAAVKFYAAEIELKKSIIDYSGINVACVGLRTADECTKFNIPVHIIPASYNALALCRELEKHDLQGKRILIPCSQIAREELGSELTRLGAIVNSVPVYETKMPLPEEITKLKDAFSRKKIDLIAFTSPSSYCNFLMIFNITSPKTFFSSYRVAAIGHTTKNAIAGSEVKVDITPDETSLKGLFKSILEYYKH